MGQLNEDILKFEGEKLELEEKLLELKNKLEASQQRFTVVKADVQRQMMQLNWLKRQGLQPSIESIHKRSIRKLATQRSVPPAAGVPAEISSNNSRKRNDRGETRRQPGDCTQRLDGIRGIAKTRHRREIRPPARYC